VRARRITLFVLMLGIAAVLQTTMGNRLSLFTARPDLVLLLVVTHSIVRGTSDGLLGGIAGGLIVDFLTPIPFGAATIGMGVVGFGTGLGESNVYRSNVIIPLIAVFLATIFYHSFLMLALQAAAWKVEWISTLALQTIPGAAINALLAPLAFPLVRRLASEAEERIGW
jgi:rod shape-determining protein MreD